MGSNRPPSDGSIERALAQRRPVTLPVQAYGGRVEWAKRPLPVWAWVQWTGSC
ncbi:hypothetical protein QWJ90_01195 [Microbacterium oryzae]|uniref:hypothetical protein n=1 Tax=Microbacterium oryzae TaxID=743009 RepID=UPI0025B03B77|nr:hypothetical protein [Microbacterium oryzae]MDN3309537.1 hypothetical protein [Microbacterium oryzae]